MLENYQKNCCLKAPGLAIHGGSSALFKYANTFAVKANGVISDDVTTADAPDLSGAKGRRNAATANLADGYSRIYTLLGLVDKDAGTVTFSLVHGDDYVNTRAPKMSDINLGNSENDDELKAVVGFVIVSNGTGADFVPGTTALDAASLTVQYIDNYGFSGL